MSLTWTWFFARKSKWTGHSLRSSSMNKHLSTTRRKTKHGKTTNTVEETSTHHQEALKLHKKGGNFLLLKKDLTEFSQCARMLMPESDAALSTTTSRFAESTPTRQGPDSNSAQNVDVYFRERFEETWRRISYAEFWEIILNLHKNNQ